MTATEVLRRLLDERGVEYEGGERSVRWRDRNGVMMQAFPLADGELGMDVWSCTPEQAIAATLGSSSCTNNCTNGERTETCKLNNFADVPFSVDYDIEGYDMDSSRDYATLAECSSCGAYVIVPPSYHHVLTCDGDEVYQPYLFCPNCGAKVVGSTTNDVDAEVSA